MMQNTIDDDSKNVFLLFIQTYAIRKPIMKVYFRYIICLQP